MPKNGNRSIDVEEITCEACLKSISAPKALSKNIDNNIAHFCGEDCFQQWITYKTSDKTDYNINFLMGIYKLWKSKYKEARSCFMIAVSETESFEPEYDVYLSYLGLSEALIDNQYGMLKHSNHSYNTSLSNIPEVQLNLACAEYIKGNRKLSIEAINKAEQFKASNRNSEYIKSFSNIIGRRQQDSKGSLKRNKIVNKVMGKLLRKRNDVESGQIEMFVKETAQKRYQAVISNIRTQAHHFATM